jgi:hypothetical protein
MSVTTYKGEKMEFHFAQPQTEFEKFFGGHFYINAIGPIRAGDAARFRDFLIFHEPPPRLTVYIDSVGGEVADAIEMGRLIRGHWYATAVGQYQMQSDHKTNLFVSRDLIDGRCMSAATLMYLGGRLRYLSEGSTFGVHQFSLKDPRPENYILSQQLSARIAKYVFEMGISADFLELSASTASDSIFRVEHSTLKEMKVVTGGETEANWSVQALQGAMYVRGGRDSLFGHHKVMLGFHKEFGFYFHAVIESQGREDELTSFGLVEIVINGEEIRLDISRRCVRDVFGIYVNIKTLISEEEAKMIAFSDSFGVQVRFSSDADLFFGISAVDTAGGQDQLQSLFATCSSN